MAWAKKIILCVCVCSVIALAISVFDNNFGKTAFRDSDVDHSFRRAVAWLSHNESVIMASNNPILWWMLSQAAMESGDRELQHLVTKYRIENYQKHSSSLWSYLATGVQRADMGRVSLADLPDYNLHFLYGFSCDESLENLEVVRQQNSLSFCWKEHPVSPACMTHQLMGFRFMQRTGCNDKSWVAGQVDRLSTLIMWQSRLDFRVVDVYLQRVLMQLDSGYSQRVNPCWLVRILEAQLADGGWGNFQPVIPLGGGRSIGFHNKGVGIAEPGSTFHATAQGVWLMALLKARPDNYVMR